MIEGINELDGAKDAATLLGRDEAYGTGWDDNSLERKRFNLEKDRELEEPFRKNELQALEKGQEILEDQIDKRSFVMSVVDRVFDKLGVTSPEHHLVNQIDAVMKLKEKIVNRQQAIREVQDAIVALPENQLRAVIESAQTEANVIHLLALREEIARAIGAKSNKDTLGDEVVQTMVDQYNKGLIHISVSSYNYARDKYDHLMSGIRYLMGENNVRQIQKDFTRENLIKKPDM